jgi:ABC-type glycerol-3-phosphate transport system permease component
MKRASRRRFKKWAGAALRWTVLLTMTTWILFPFFWAISCSLRPVEKLFTVTPDWLPRPFTLDNYRWALNEPDFRIPFMNSFIVSGATALFAIGLGALAAFGLARLRYPGKRAIITAMLSTQMLPTMLVIIPIFLIYASTGLYNTYPGLVLASTAWTLPYAVLLLRSFFCTLSVSLEEQAMVDGCSRIGAFLRVTLPLSAAGVVAVSVYVFIWTWGDMLFPLILAKNIDRQTAALSLFNMMQSTRGATNYSGLLAAGVIFTLPAVVLFILLQRQLVEGLTAGSLKE